MMRIDFLNGKLPDYRIGVSANRISPLIPMLGIAPLWSHSFDVGKRKIAEQNVL
jgi:hypothetical protein